jgi:hypothetical protein
MEPPRDDQLIADLQALRPTPRPQFAAELDERAAAGFPRRSRTDGRLERLRAWLSSLGVRQILIPAGGLAAVVIVVATATLVIGQGGGQTSEDQIALTPAPTQLERGARSFDGAGKYSHGAGRFEPFSEEVKPSSAASAQATAGAPAAEAESLTSFNGRFHHRAVERSAEITLAAKPENVADDADKVFKAVHAHDGIVMRSSTQEGAPGEAGATFDLLIPSAKLGDAMAAFSEIDHVRSRHEATADITAPIATSADLLKESRARIDSLLSQLEGAGTEEEQEAIEAELRHERRHASRLAGQLDHLHKRADFSRVSLRIETGAKESSNRGGAWGIDDALHDAGHVLTVAAAVTLIALAILGPIALIALLAWLTHRAWVRRERRRVLS